ncbi:MAG: RidA family protein [Chloroflexi bacterium]|nr:RidA family protein [Chloroflexota bacterium]
MSRTARVTLVQANGVAATTAPYSHALIVEAGRLLFISGQGPVDANGDVVGIGDPHAQVRQVFANIQALVEAAGGSLADIVELTAYLRDMSYRSIITEVRKELLKAPYPTATMVEISKLAFDDWLVEISAVTAL